MRAVPVTVLRHGAEGPAPSNLGSKGPTTQRPGLSRRRVTGLCTSSPPWRILRFVIPAKAGTQAYGLCDHVRRFRPLPKGRHPSPELMKTSITRIPVFETVVKGVRAV